MLLLLLSLKIDATLANRVCRLRSCNSKSCVVVDKNMAPSSQNFLQKVFNTISLLKNEELWLSTDDDLTEERLQLVASFSETQFAPQLKLDCASNAKSGKLSSALREKGNLCYAQGDCDSALRLYNQVCKIKEGRNQHIVEK